jgi:hypothetical protein
VHDDGRFEQLIAFIGSQLPSPVDQYTADDDTLVITGGTPAEVIVHVTRTSVVVSACVGIWDGRERFRVAPRRIGLLKWQRLTDSTLMNALGALIKGARAHRLEGYRPCTMCGVKHPPEALVGSICALCGDQPSPVVH